MFGIKSLSKRIIKSWDNSYGSPEFKYTPPPPPPKREREEVIKGQDPNNKCIVWINENEWININELEHTGWSDWLVEMYITRKGNLIIKETIKGFFIDIIYKKPTEIQKHQYEYWKTEQEKTPSEETEY